MYAGTETSSDIRHVGVAVDGGEKPEAVDDERVGILKHGIFAFLPIFDGGVSDSFPSVVLQQKLNLRKVVFADDMRCDDEFPVCATGEIRDEDFFVRLP